MTKTILIVGGASGIGLEAARILKTQGHRVIIADIQDPAWDVPYIAMDLGKPSSCRAALERIRQDYAPLDSVVITAAVHSAYPVEYMPDELIDHAMNVNLTGHMKFVRDVLPAIKDGGRIVAVSSIAAGVGIPMESLYSASKAGLEIFYESLAAEISYRRMSCSIIQPGNVNTGFNEKGNDFKGCGKPFVDESYKKIVERIDSRHGISPVDVAKDIIKALTSPNPKFCYVTGLNALKAHWAKRILGRDLTLKVMNKFFGI
jgi:NAD(P)-dependent dehydrogenase (short-subunit alcohol dehydrogenase family)